MTYGLEPMSSTLTAYNGSTAKLFMHFDLLRYKTLHSWRWPANRPSPALGLQLTGDYYVGKQSDTGQPAQPFILPGSINK